MGKKLYLECSSGISGDMFVAAMIDLGADVEVLMEGIKSLPVQGFDVKIKRVKKSGLDACDFDVVLDAEHENHDHDMEYLHGHSHEHHHHDHHHHNDEEAHHHHEETHTHHQHQHRGLPEVIEIINQSAITPHAKEMAVEIFTVLAKAEAKAHGLPENEVHFHEVGAVDSIVDIVAGAICVDNLGIEEVIVPKLSEGIGMVRCQHGMLPIPVPAVANIVAEHGIRVHITDIEGELVTPTGAAIVAALRTSDKLPNEFLIEKTGLGAGKREYACVGVLRAMVVSSISD